MSKSRSSHHTSIVDQLKGNTMKKITLAVMFGLASGLGLSSLVTATENTISEGTQLFLVAYEDCNKVLEVELNQAQGQAYLALKDQEIRFETASKPLKQLEAVMRKHEAKLPQFDEPYSLTSEQIKQLEAVTTDIEQVASDIDAEMVTINQVAEEFEAVAKTFEEQLKPILGEQHYQQVQIVEAKNKDKTVCLAGMR